MILTIINFICAIISLTIALVFFAYRMNHKKKRTHTIKEVMGFDLPISFYVPEGIVACVSLHQPDKTKIPYGWAVISEVRPYKDATRIEATIWMIYTREEFRGKGYAKKLISFLQNRYDVLMTQYENGLTSSPGTKLCMSCGFKIKPSMFKRVPSTLVWRKSDKEGVHLDNQ